MSAAKKAKLLKPHPAADLFPMMSEGELNELAADIRQRGQLEAIIVTTTGKEDLILDGRNRYEACRRAEVEPYVLTWDEEQNPTASATAFVLSKNLHRRHLNETQRAVVAADALPMFEAEAKKRMISGGKKGKGAPRGTPLSSILSPEPVETSSAKKGRASEAAAKAVGASSRSVARAKRVLETKPELREQLRAAKITLKQAEKAIRKEQQLKNVLEYRPPVGTYAVIVADVPWQYDDQLDGSDQVRGGTPYPPMPLEEILKIKPPAAPDCALWFWTTNAFLIDGTAAQVVKAWGFEAKALYTWRKVAKNGNDRLGTGHYGQSVTEHVILAVKGKPMVDAAGQANIFDAPRSRHSEKPQRFFEIAEKVTPCPPEARIELFAIEERKGWVTSGSEQQAKARSARSGLSADVHAAIDKRLAEADEKREAELPRVSQHAFGLITWFAKKHPSQVMVGEGKSGRYVISRERATSGGDRPKKTDVYQFRWALNEKGWPPSPPFRSIDEAQTDAEAAEETRRGPQTLFEQQRLADAEAALAKKLGAVVDDGTLCGIRPSKNGDGCIHKQGHDGVHSNGRTTWRERKGRKLPAVEDVEASA